MYLMDLESIRLICIHLFIHSFIHCIVASNLVAVWRYGNILCLSVHLCGPVCVHVCMCACIHP